MSEQGDLLAGWTGGKPLGLGPTIKKEKPPEKVKKPKKRRKKVTKIEAIKVLLGERYINKLREEIYLEASRMKNSTYRDVVTQERERSLKLLEENARLKRELEDLRRGILP